MIEYHRNPCFLPSNAPALPNALPSALDRALQERSGNRQRERFQTDHSPQYNKFSTSRTTNTFSTTLSSSFAPHVRYYDPRGRTPKEREREAQLLFRELQRAEGYQKYRSRQPKTAKEARDQKWPDHMEWAFFRATVEHLPMGRRKEDLEGVLRGRNELIAAYVTRVTGEWRGRKQVSSHIQVLKPFFKDNPRIMYYLADDATTPKRMRRNALSDVERGRRHEQPVLPSHSDNSPSRSNSFSNHDSGLYAGSLPSMPSEPSSTDFVSTALKPFDFDMFVQDTRPKPPLTIHTFTKSAEQLLDCNLDETGLTLQWELMFPQIAAQYHAGTLSCPVIYAEASLELMTHPIPEDAQLGIRFEFTGTEHLDMGAHHWECSTKFYDREICVDQSAGPVAYDMELTKRLHTVPFGSSFWARKFVDFAKPIREARKALEAAGSRHHAFDSLVSGPKDMLRQTEENVRQRIRDLSAVQEICATPLSGGHTERILLIYWKFKQTVRGEQGKMQWRNLILPTQTPLSSQTDQFNNFPLDFGAPPFLGSASTSCQSISGVTDPTSSFEFNASLTLAGLSSSEVVHHPVVDTPLSLHNLDHHPDNAIDFNAGQINICMEPSVSMESFDSSLAEQVAQYTLDVPGTQVHQQQQQQQDHQQQFSLGQWVGYGGIFDAPVVEGFAGQVFLDPQMEGRGHEAYYQGEYAPAQVGVVGFEERE